MPNRTIDYRTWKNDVVCVGACVHVYIFLFISIRLHAAGQVLVDPPHSLWYSICWTRPWKDAQISYLKALQTGDLRRRRDQHANSNEMFLAFAAEPALVASPETPLIVDNAEILNLPNFVATQPFVRGELLGFVEITQRRYGLGEGGIGIGSDRSRPILTNLAVSRSARTLGIGSKLLDRCERHVAERWRMNEIVLEVEDYNTRALDFYTKRGYKILYSDPASRRFDVSGLVLRKIRCTRQVLRKDLTWQIAKIAEEQLAGRSWFSQFVPRGGRFYYK